RRCPDIPLRLCAAVRARRLAPPPRRRTGAGRHPRLDRGRRGPNRPGAQHRRPIPLTPLAAPPLSRLSFVSPCATNRWHGRVPPAVVELRSALRDEPQPPQRTLLRG